MTDKNIILTTDSYKHSHGCLYPVGTNALTGYVEARTKGDVIVPFGLQMWIEQTLTTPITVAMVDEAETVLKLHGLPFDREAWMHVISTYGGFLPLTIRGFPEGTRVPSLTPIATVTCMDPKVFWLASLIETEMQRGIWYPTTVASRDYANWMQLKWFYEKGSDNPDALVFALHSFGSRGTTSGESAAIGGLAHLLYFRGTDDLAALVAGRKYYNCAIAGFSVPATEHSVQTSYGVDNQSAYFDSIFDHYIKPGGIVSVVMDGYDIDREVDLLCSEKYRNKLLGSGAKLVVRPDSGDMFEIVPRLLEKLSAAYGVTFNSKGKMLINNIGIIQGDGIDSTTLGMLAQRVHDKGFAPECVVYGSGGGLLQKLDRDTYKFAQKTSAIRVGDKWIPTVKDPITDPGKKSKGGLIDYPQFVTFYKNGKILVDDTLDQIRARATA